MQCGDGIVFDCFDFFKVIEELVDNLGLMQLCCCGLLFGRYMQLGYQYVFVEFGVVFGDILEDIECLFVVDGVVFGVQVEVCDVLCDQFVFWIRLDCYDGIFCFGILSVMVWRFLVVSFRQGVVDSVE